jgi:hypothetical protein
MRAGALTMNSTLNESQIVPACQGVVVPEPAFDTYSVLAYVFVSMGIVLSLCGHAFIFYHRDSAVMQLSQSNFLHGFCACLVFINIGSLVRTRNSYVPLSNALCIVETWILVVALSVSFVVLTSKVRQPQPGCMPVDGEPRALTLCFACRT